MRTWNVVAVLAVSTALTAGCSEDPAPAEPTIVLVHGSFSDSSSWDAVAGQLRERGYPVVQVDNPLRGLRSDADAVTAAIADVRGPVVLVGHSYGGAVISNMRRADVSAVVFVAGFAPAEGEAVQQLSDPAKYPGSRLGPALRIRPTETGAEATLAAEQYGEVFAQDVSAEIASKLAARQRSTAAAAQAEPSGEPLWTSVPSWYVLSTEDRALPPASQRFQAERAKAQVREVNSSHAVQVSHPDEVTAVIVAAAD
ncbi:alpha/beta hydrolase [Nocardia sp. NPDC127579]|uniref:alpha/beta hydrolase n=1 Tax=Nocardia sp. NPDC127579 TaxID=3345402 RepID=UPI00363284CF